MIDSGPLVAVRTAARRPGPAQDAPAEPDSLGPLLARIALLVTAVSVGLIVWSSGPPDVHGQQGLHAFLDREHLYGLPWWITFGLIEELANVAMFMPVGFFGALALRRRSALVIPSAAAGSAIIELGQFFFLPERDGSLHDVVMNTLGALLGLLLATPRLARRRRRRIRSDAGRRGPRDRARPPVPPDRLEISRPGPDW